MNLSIHFTLDELTVSQTAARENIDNTPSAETRANLIRLATTMLEPIRHTLGDKPLQVSSGYRSPQLNRAVGGAASSAHISGRAADFTVPGLTLGIAYDAIVRSDLPFDQLIAEYARWIHVAVPILNALPRRQMLQKLAGRGYEAYSPSQAWEV